MLEIKNLVKTYSTKGGVTVRALDDISVQFPATGMVFLLGRSGSGKSTLLNVSGGLDKPDSGEVIVKGRSSKNFSESDFDSYRNTFVGFIFQEYNILNEFTVEQNIALALQLQNKPNDKKVVEALLEQVDLKGLGKRKPNTLSGGQKQRVAIARALIKEPEIIMADEPTGALDSNTGKQVFDTLKKLSKSKLVVVVSHDRDFAKQYGDRIIELADGKIISDLSKDKASPEKITENVQKISEDTIAIKDTEKVTEEEVKSILSILKKSKGEAIITSGSQTLTEIKKVCKVDEDGNREYFKQTEKVKVQEHDGKNTKFIKSRLPASHAFKMGASGLKTKPIRLIFTILLSVLAFAMFGVSSTLMLYDSSFSISKALQEANNPSVTLSKEYNYVMQGIKIDNQTGKKEIDYEQDNTNPTMFGVQEVRDKSNNGLDFAGVFNLMGGKQEVVGSRITIRYVNKASRLDLKSPSEYYPVIDAFGFSDCGAEYLSRNGFRAIAGEYPTDATEIAIPKYFAEIIVGTEDFGLNSISDLIGKKINISNCPAIRDNSEFTIVGVYDVGNIDAKYEPLKDKNSEISLIERQELMRTLADFLSNSFHTVIFVSSDFYETYSKNQTQAVGGYYVMGTPTIGLTFNPEPIEFEVGEMYVSPLTDFTVSMYDGNFTFYDANGNEKEFSLNDNEIYISKYEFDRPYFNTLENLYREMMGYSKHHPEAQEYFSGKDYFIDFYKTGVVEEVIEAIDKWYQILHYREFLIGASQALTNKYYSMSDEERMDITSFDEFYASYQRVESYWPWDEESIPPTEQDYEIINSFVKTNLPIYMPSTTYLPYLIQLGKVMFNKGIGEEYFSNLLEGYDYYSIYNYLIYGGFSEQELQTLISAIERDYKTYVSAEMKEWEECFIPDYSYTPIGEYYYKNSMGETGTLKVKGYFVSKMQSDGQYVVKKDFLREHALRLDEGEYTWMYNEITDYVIPEDARYNCIISATQNTMEQIQSVMHNEGIVSYKIKGEVFESIAYFLTLITNMNKIFLILGVVFGVFAGLMLVNFISVSISAKKKDIGILRAVGARGADVFKIFFSEAGIIAFICFMLASVGSYIVCGVLNAEFSDIVNMELLNFGLINIVLILAISFVVSLMATFFPVYFASKKSPVDSIRAL